MFFAQDFDKSALVLMILKLHNIVCYKCQIILILVWRCVYQSLYGESRELYVCGGIQSKAYLYI